MRKESVALILCAIALVCAGSFDSWSVKNAQGASMIIVPDDYSTIQGAVNGATDGDTIFVRTGTYYEHLVVNRTVSLVGESVSATIVDGGGTGNVFAIRKNSVSINGFTVQNSGRTLGNAGLRLDRVSLCNISGNRIRDNFAGIWFEESSKNLIAANNITSNVDDGIVFDYSHNNTVSGNHIALHEYFGIVINWSHNNTISYNNVTQTIGLSHGDGINLWNSDHNEVFQNNVEENNRYGIRVEGQSNNNTISENKVKNCATGLQLYDSSNYNHIHGNNVTNCPTGIELNQYIAYTILSGNMIENSVVGINIKTSSANNIISRNLLTANSVGLRLSFANLNKVLVNNITGNDVGVEIQFSQNNMLYSNVFMSNTQQASISVSGYANAWDSGYPSGGNYWSDYTGVDSDGDGIGDSPYIIDGNNQDRYPLMNPYGPWFCDVNSDSIVDGKDIAIVAKAFGSYLTHPRWNPHADINQDGMIEGKDIARVAKYFGWHA